MFRTKRLITSARINPYWRRFTRNASKLKQLGIPTLDVIEAMKIPHLRRTAVHYRPLPGSALRELETIDETLVEKLGRFICSLHDKGVYLRSMHLGNVVKTPDGELGLIDIADMKIRSGPLSRNLRLRNCRHLSRYAEDRQVIIPHLNKFVGAFDVSMQKKLTPLFSQPPG